jgi:hypothetical protein
MSVGEKLQILSVALVIAGAIVGFIGTKLSDTGYLKTFAKLASDVGAAERQLRSHSIASLE